MVSTCIIAFAIASQEVAADKTTCNYAGSIGSMKYDCSVPHVEKSCCDVTVATAKCGIDLDCFKKAYEKAGLDMQKMTQDPAYAKSKCPVLASLGGGKEAMEKYCKIDMGDKIPLDAKLLKTGDCTYGNDAFSCTIPGVKDICCTVTKAMVACGSEDKSAGCQAATLKKLIPKLQAAGFDTTRFQDEAYQHKFCPVMSDPNQGKYCKAATKLFSLIKPGDALTSAPVKTNMAFGVFCGVFFIASFAVVVRRRWQATAVEIFEPLEVELKAEQGLVE